VRDFVRALKSGLLSVPLIVTTVAVFHVIIPAGEFVLWRQIVGWALFISALSLWRWLMNWFEGVGR
jgi:hypothetical protein